MMRTMRGAERSCFSLTWILVLLISIVGTALQKLALALIQELVEHLLNVFPVKPQMKMR